MATPKGFTPDGFTPDADVPAGFTPDGFEPDGETTAPKPSYNVDLTSKKAKAKYQLEDLQRNPEFKKMSKLEQARLLGEAGGEFESPYAKAGLKEIPRFAAESIMMPVNSVRKVGTDIATIGKAGLGAVKGMLPGNDFMDELTKGAQAGTDLQNNFKPWGTGMEPSVTGQKIGEVFSAGEEGLGALTGNPELAKQVMGVATNTLGIAPIAKGVMKRTAAVGPMPDGTAMKPQSGFGAGFTEPSPVGQIGQRFAPTYAKARAYAEKNVPTILKGKMSTPKTYKQLAEQAPQTVNGMELIVDDARAGKISLDGESRVPQSRMEWAEAQDQSLTNIANRMHEEVAAAGGAGIKASTAPFAAELRAFSELPEVKVGNAPAVAAAKSMADTLDSVQNMTPAQIADTLAGINTQLKAFYKGGQMNDIGKVVVLDNTARYLRQALNDAVDSVGGDSHAALRKSYGDQAASRDAVVKAAAADRGVPQHLGFGEVLSAAQMAHGIAAFNPAVATSGGLLLGMKKAYQYWESPNRRVKAAFDKLDKTKPVTEPRPEIVPRQPRPVEPTPYNDINPEVVPPKEPSGLGDYIPDRPQTIASRDVQFGGNGVGTVRRNVQPPPADPALTQPVSRNVQPPPADPALTQPVSRNVQPQAPTPLEWDGRGLPPAEPIDLKASVKAVGGGKKGVADVAKQMGVPAAVLATWLLADEKKKKQLAMLPAFAVFGSILNQKGNMRNLTEKTPSYVAREIANPSKNASMDIARNKQVDVKGKIIQHAVPSGLPVRMTSLRELNTIADTGQLRMGATSEGSPGISAQIVPKVADPPIQSYGGNEYPSVAIVFPKTAEIAKGINPNEVKINPSLDVNKARFIIPGYKRMITFTELKSLYKKGKLGQ
jgi:hypothetical protein